MNKQETGAIPISLNVKPNFSGFVVVQMNQGAVTGHFPLKSGGFFGSLDSFINAAITAGYQVIPPAAQG